MISYFSGKSLQLVPPDASILAKNARKCVWWPGSARTRWGSLSAPPDPLAAKKMGPTSKRRGGKGKRGRGEEEREREGKGTEGEVCASPLLKTFRRPCM